MSSTITTKSTPEGLDPFWASLSQRRRRQQDKSVQIATEMLQKNPADEAAWLLKCRTLTDQNALNELEIDDTGMADILLDEKGTSKFAKPGTSFQSPLTSISQTQRPMSKAGRPTTGFQRPGTQSNQQGSQLMPSGTARPITSGGRMLRLGTASLQRMNSGDKFIDINRIDVNRMSQKPFVSKALMRQLLQVEQNPKVALSLSTAVEAHDKKSWWWKNAMAIAQQKLGLYREAEQYLMQALSEQKMSLIQLWLSRVYVKFDQPKNAIKTLEEGIRLFPNDAMMPLHMARCQDCLNDVDGAINMQKKVLQVECCSIEAIASIANHHFYSDQPEISLRFYKRLVMTGVINAEIWSNLGLCCFYSGQQDLCLMCFEKAIKCAGTDVIADIWQNIGHVAIAIGDLSFAYQSFKISVSQDPNHVEAYNNLGVLEIKKGHIDQAKTNFFHASKNNTFIQEPIQNYSLLNYKIGDQQTSYQYANKCLDVQPDHLETNELKSTLEKQFVSI